MKALLAALLLSALPALAGSFTVTSNAAQDNALTRAMNRSNKQTCQRFSLPNACTQVQAREQFCRVAGFGGQRVSTPDPPRPPIITFTPLVSVCAGSTAVTVYSTLDSFVQDEWKALLKENYGKKADDEDTAAFVAARQAATKAQRDAACQALGLPPGCLP